MVWNGIWASAHAVALICCNPASSPALRGRVRQRLLNPLDTGAVVSMIRRSPSITTHLDPWAFNHSRITTATSWGCSTSRDSQHFLPRIHWPLPFAAEKVASCKPRASIVTTIVNHGLPPAHTLQTQHADNENTNARLWSYPNCPPASAPRTLSNAPPSRHILRVAFSR